MSNYLAWRCTYQDSEAAAREAYNQYEKTYRELAMAKKFIDELCSSEEGKKVAVETAKVLGDRFKAEFGPDKISFWDVFLETLK